MFINLPDGQPSIDHEVTSAVSATGNRMQALKSLAELLLHEVKFLETLPMKNSQDIVDGIGRSLSDELLNYEVRLIRGALIRTNGHQANAAKILGLKTTTLNTKLKRLGIDPRSFSLSGFSRNIESSIS